MIGRCYDAAKIRYRPWRAQACELAVLDAQIESAAPFLLIQVQILPRDVQSRCSPPSSAGEGFHTGRPLLFWQLAAMFVFQKSNMDEVCGRTRILATGAQSLQ